MYRTELVIRKNTVRNFLWEYLISNPTEYYRIAAFVYPEINRDYLRTSSISLKQKIVFLSILLHIYPIIYKVGHTLKCVLKASPKSIPTK